MKKKVLIIPSWYVSEEWPRNGIFFKEQAEAFAQYADYDTSVVVPLFRSLKFLPKRLKGKEGTYIENNVKTYFEELYYYKYIGNINIYNWTKVGKRLLGKYIDENGMPDIIHFQSVLISYKLIEYVYEVLKIPYIITEHSTEFINGEKFNVSRFLKSFRNSGKLFAVSKGFCEHLENRTGCKWEYMPNFINENYFQPAAIEIKNDKFTIGTLSILEKKKAVQNLLEAFAKMSIQNEVNLIIAGDGEERDALENLSISLGLEDRVKFTGALNRDQVLRTMQTLDLFVLPSDYETFGVVLIEAIAVGKPIVATKSIGPESIINEVCGLLCEVNNPKSIARAIEEIYFNYGEYKSHDIRQYFLDNFSSVAVCKKLKLTYDNIILQ